MMEKVIEKVIEKEIEILQSNFKHYYGMAIDHYTKAGSTSHILLVIVGALLAMIGFDKNICCTQIDFVCSILVILVGLFGVYWSGRQMARYRYWEYIALRYQEKLEEVLPDFHRKYFYENDANKKEKKAFFKPLGIIFAKLPDKYLWIFLHLGIMVFGVVLLILSQKKC